MRCSYEFKRKCVEIYLAGSYPVPPEGGLKRVFQVDCPTVVSLGSFSEFEKP